MKPTGLSDDGDDRNCGVLEDGFSAKNIISRTPGSLGVGFDI